MRIVGLQCFTWGLAGGGGGKGSHMKRLGMLVKFELKSERRPNYLGVV